MEIYNSFCYFSQSYYKLKNKSKKEEKVTELESEWYSWNVFRSNIIFLLTAHVYLLLKPTRQ